MASFNRVMLLGNLTRDPQMRYLPSQTPVTDFGLACNRKFKTASGEQREEVLFVDCSAFGRQAEVINQYCTKGKPIFVEGRLKYDTWDDKNGGGKRSKLTVVVENFQLLGGRDGGAPAGDGGHESSGDEGGGRPAPSRAPASRPPPSRGSASGPAASGPAAEPQPPFGDEQHFKDDDIPF
jgi:single-strand DNA-binding protein